jgi:hypothetical protein
MLLTGKPQIYGEKSVPVPLCLHKSHNGLTWDWTRPFAVTEANNGRSIVTTSLLQQDLTGKGGRHQHRIYEVFLAVRMCIIVTLFAPV